MPHPPATFDTTLVHLGRTDSIPCRTVNPPVCRGSTLLFPTMEELWAADGHWHTDPSYGRHGTPPTFAFEQAIADLEGGYRGIAVCSGLAALSTALASVVKAGDDILIQDSVYSPTRKFCDGFLSKFGVTARYFAPEQAGNIADLFLPNTRAVYVESPGSMTFEMVDIRAVAAAANAAGIITIADSTWATPLGYRPYNLGVNINIHAATKYIGGHSDALLGVITADEAHFMSVKKTAALLGHHASPDDIYLGQRGLRTLGVRMRQHQATALTLADWLWEHEAVSRVLYPPHPKDRYHELWRRDFTLGCGLFGVVLKPHYSMKDAVAWVNSLKYFGIGYSWGGFESLALAVDLRGIRTASALPEGALVRLHAGLEDVEDLKQDLARYWHGKL